MTHSSIHVTHSSAQFRQFKFILFVFAVCPFSVIEPWVYIHLTPTTGLHVKAQIIDWLFARTGVLIWSFQPSINDSVRVSYIQTWFVCAVCSLAQNLLFCGSCFSTSVAVSALGSPSHRTLLMHKRSLFLSHGFPFWSSAPVTLTTGCCGCFGGEHPVYSPGFWVSSVHLQVSSRQRPEPLLGCLLSFW